MYEILETDLIVARRTMLNDCEIFDLFIHETSYYRMVITNYFNENKVTLRTNIDDFSEEPLFEYQSYDVYLDALFTQLRFVFVNFIENEYRANGLDFDVEVEVVDIENITLELDRLKKDFEEKLENCTEEDLESDEALIGEIEEKEEELNSVVAALDEIFIGEEQLMKIIKNYDEPQILS